MAYITVKVNLGNGHPLRKRAWHSSLLHAQVAPLTLSVRQDIKRNPKCTGYCRKRLNRTLTFSSLDL